MASPEKEAPRNSRTGALSRLKRQAFRLCRDNKAIALPLFAIMFAAMLAFLGLVYDGGRIYFEKRRMQVAADAGARGGAWELDRGQPTAVVISGGRDDAALNGFADGVDNTTVTINTPPQSGPWQGITGCVECIISQQFPTTLMRIANITDSTVASRAVACVQPDQTPKCVIALDCGCNDPGLRLSGSGTLATKNCDIHVNSCADDAIRLDGTGGGCPMLSAVTTDLAGNIIDGDTTICHAGDPATSTTLVNGSGGCIECPDCETAGNPADFPLSNCPCINDPLCPGDVPGSATYPNQCECVSANQNCVVGEGLAEPWNGAVGNPPPTFQIPTITATNWNDGVTFPPCPANPIAPCYAANEPVSYREVTDPSTSPPTTTTNNITGALLLPPGYYMTQPGQGIRVNAGVVKLLPGFFNTEQFTVNGGIVVGDGVQVYVNHLDENVNTNSDDWAIDIRGNPFIDMSSIPDPPILFWNSRYGTRDCRFTGGGNTFYQGGLYCPTGMLDFSGNTITSGGGSQSFATLIGWRIEISGTANLEISLDPGGGGNQNPFQTVTLVE